MPVASGWVTGFFLYDVAEAIDLDAVGRLMPSTPARMAPKPPSPPYVQYAQPPVAIDGRAIDLPLLDGWQVRFKALACGVVSLALTRSPPGTWDDVASCADRRCRRPRSRGAAC